MVSFEYKRPASLDDALSLRDKWGESSSLLLGGTDLFLAIEDGVVSPEMIIDLKNIPGLNCLEEKDDSIIVGAGMTYSDLIKSSLVRKSLPGIWESSRLVASVGIRNSATMVGNICNAVPSAESAAPLMVRDARIHIASKSGERVVPITTFFTGPRKTVVSPGEIVTKITIPLVKEDFGESYIKLGRYRGEDIAQVCVSVFVDSQWNYKIAFGAVGPVPMRIHLAESILKGNPPTPELIVKAQDAIIESVSPITDIRASKEYRLHMCRIMLEKAVSAAVSRMISSEPALGTRLM